MNPMQDPHYPVFLNLTDKAVLLVGGGEVAFRKARALKESGCMLTVVAKEFAGPFTLWLEDQGIERQRRAYRAGEAGDYFLVISATDDEQVNRRVFEDASRAERLVNVVDQPLLCNILIPSVVQRGSLRVAISTAGKCPALARHLRLDLEKHLPEHYGPLLEQLSVIRTHLKRTIASPSDRKQILEKVLTSAAVARFLSGDDVLLKRMVTGWERAKPR
jgi:siroheme synthase-like protein